MTTLVMIDGCSVAPEQATVSVFDRGFLYGDAVFETIRTYGGLPFALDEHLERLARSASSVLIELPLKLTALREEVVRAVREASNPEAYVRVMLTRGRGEALGLDPGLAKQPLRVVIVTPLVSPPASFYSEGIAVVTYPTSRLADETAASGAKLANYLIAVLATRAATERGAKEALIVDREGRVLEGSTSNVFAVVAGRVLTAPEELGVLAGVTRRHVIELLGEQGREVDLRSLRVEELTAADEVFITSSIREIVPVVAVDEKPIASGRPGPLATALLGQFRERASRLAQA